MVDNIRELALRALAEKFSSHYKTNPKFDRKRERTWWQDPSHSDEEPGNEYYIPRTMEERMQDDCMTVYTAPDGHPAIRPLHYPEIVDALIEAGLLVEGMPRYDVCPIDGMRLSKIEKNEHGAVFTHVDGQTHPSLLGRMRTSPETLSQFRQVARALEDWVMRDEIAEKPDWAAFGRILLRLNVLSGRPVETVDAPDSPDEDEADALDHRTSD